MNNVIVPAHEIRTEDRIDYNGQVCIVVFAALVRGVKIELKIKATGLQARMSPERTIIVTKNTPITKVI